MNLGVDIQFEFAYGLNYDPVLFKYFFFQLGKGRQNLSFQQQFLSWTELVIDYFLSIL